MNMEIRRLWKNRDVFALCKKSGCADPLQAIKAKARDLVTRSGASRPPFSPFLMGSLQGVVKVRFRPIGFDACLIPVDRGFEVHICSNHPESRQNFSMAHEVGHLFFMESTGEPGTARRDKRIGYHTIDDEEEYLCDIAASELIFPGPFFDDDVDKVGPSLRGVLELANLYRASLQATALKYAATGIWK